MTRQRAANSSRSSVTQAASAYRIAEARARASGAALGRNAFAHFADLALRDAAAGRHAVSQPHVAANHRPTPYSHASKNGRAGVDDHVIFHDRMPRVALDEHAVVAGRKTLRAKRHR